ncbi:MAG: hypothetical protein HN341_14180 [Verrucomicrobia bacterium]|jgi:hypothetical protein|nr:hypothetical protein [Verrucomicrobiota bacterium]
MKQRSRGIWVHVCCEGWVALGPFEWVAMDDERNALVDEHGDLIAGREEDGWRVPDERYQGYRFRTPMVTTSRKHPAPMQGCLPFAKNERDHGAK